MRRRLVIIFWLLLLVPTLLISTALFRLLRQEQVRMAEAVHARAQEGARGIAETIRLTTHGVEQTITQALLVLSRDDLQEQLPGLVWTTDLVSEVFIWSPDQGLLLPVLGEDASPGEKRFAQRYGPLFTGRIPWERRPDAEGEGDVSKRLAGRKGPPARKALGREPGGWMPWVYEEGFFVLGWVQNHPDQLIYGAELNLGGLLEWLVNYFPANVPKEVVFALVDRNGRVLHQAGESAPAPGAEPDVSISLAPSLPFWNLVMYVDADSLVARSGRSFLILGGLLIAIFVVAIILGGGMLMWEANRNMAMAQQKSTFVSNVSHELKTPLTSIRMYAELLKEGRIKDPGKKTHYLQVIVAESQRLTRLVNNVLDFGRLEKGVKQYHVHNVDLPGLLRDVVETQRLRVQKAGMTLENEILQEEAATVRTDPDALEQVVLNLMDNAVKYAGGGRELVVSLKKRGACFHLLVMDRGPGIPVKHRERIFEKFHRVDSSLTSRQPGSGLGLSIARSIMRELDGDITYEPRSAGGSCFVVRIPRTPADSTGHAQEGAAHA